MTFSHQTINEFYSKYLYLSLKNKGLKELLIFLLFLVFYKISRYFAIGDEQTAFHNAHFLVDIEMMLGIFYEIDIQQYFLNSHLLVTILNKFYVTAHLPITIAFFVWLYHQKKTHYKFVRNGFLLANTLTLYFYVNFPCAPPRMLNDIGFTDTLLKISDVNLYSGVFSGLFNQYAAVPSMHFGNALLIGVVVAFLTKNKITTWLLLLYPIFVLLVIVVTGNHFFMDAIVGGIVVLLPYPFLYLAKKVKVINLQLVNSSKLGLRKIS
ncbi:MAG: phosphatase PAP2 family protein [Vicingaceae bacterium]|nr:phosphatase PAP2 family protein [Vicingaceae bacterium]